MALKWLGRNDAEKMAYRKELAAAMDAAGVSNVLEIKDDFDRRYLEEHPELSEPLEEISEEATEKQPARKKPTGKSARKATPEKMTDAGRPTMEEYKQRVSDLLIKYQEEIDCKDIRKIKPQEWRGFCMYCGRVVFADRKAMRAPVMPSNSAMPTNNNAYDSKLIEDLYQYYTELCARIGMWCRITDFFHFVGMGKQVSADVLDRLTREGSDLPRKMREEMADSTAGTAASGRINTVVGLAWLNTFDGWATRKEVVHTTENRSNNAEIAASMGLLLSDNSTAPGIPERARTETQ